jgi:hypothetical protein
MIVAFVESSRVAISCGFGVPEGCKNAANLKEAKDQCRP